MVEQKSSATAAKLNELKDTVERSIKIDNDIKSITAKSKEMGNKVWFYFSK